MHKMKDLESRLQREVRDTYHRCRPQSSHTHSIETDSSYREDQTNHISCTDDEVQGEDEGSTSQVIDAYIAEVNSAVSKNSSLSWYLDSGTSNHVSGDPKVFSSLIANMGTKITSAGGQGHDIIGIGSIAIRLPNGEIQKINHVLYSLGILKNLLSVGFLTDKGYKLEFMQQVCIIKSSSGDIIATAIRDSRNGLYKLRGDTLLHCSEVLSNSTNLVHSCSTDRITTTKIWHRRLGHYHSQGLRRMVSSNAVTCLPNMTVRNTPCHTCLHGKQSQSSIPKQRTSYSKRILELVYTDLIGPFRIPSLGRSSYFITFTDDYSRKTWVYFLHSKDECFNTFCSFH